MIFLTSSNYMKIEFQVVRVELAKKLAELGVKRVSIFGWLNYNDGESELIHFYDGVLIPSREQPDGNALVGTYPTLRHRHFQLRSLLFGSG